jgi:pimeloyl-ACP methyl ester carboxylesterase
MPPKRLLPVGLLAGALLAGCVSAPQQRAAAPAGERAVVFVVGGIGGLDPLQLWAPVALPRAGVTHEIRVFEWTHGKFRFLRDLQDARHLVAEANRLADSVREALALGRPVYLLGHSAGAGLVLEAAGRLPPGSLERVVVLSAAVSPTYDLRPALRASRGGVVSFNSCCDLFTLSWGTTQFGTVDRVYGPAAGLDGFRVPDGLDAEGQALYARLVQRPWKWGMLLEGCGGGHHGPTMPLFLARHVAPWLRGPAEVGAGPRADVK